MCLFNGKAIPKFNYNLLIILDFRSSYNQIFIYLNRKKRQFTHINFYQKFFE